jgi:hypothetical protein
MKDVPEVCIEDAMANTNSNFEKGEEWRTNCQRCVYAYEMNRRGVVCEAKPSILDEIDYCALSWENVMKNQTWKKVGSKRRKSAIQNIENKMAEFGDGSRGIIYLKWKDGRSHVFNVENTEGKIKYIEAQSGKEIRIKSYMRLANPTTIKLSRVDNLEPNWYIMNQAIERKSK